MENRRNVVESLYLQGHSLRYIGRELSVDPKTVLKDINAIREEWRSQRVQKLDDEINHQLAKYDLIETQAWIGWERSLKNAVEKVAEEGETKDGPYQKRRRKNVLQSGDPRFLKIIDDVLASRRQLLGLNAPSKVEMTSVIKSVEVEVKTPDDVITLHELIHKQKEPTRGALN
jgi:hypothetical protein